MAPVGQYVFAEMQWITEHFTAGSHEWLPYSKNEVRLKSSNTNLTLTSLFVPKGLLNCQLSIRRSRVYRPVCSRI